jgi:hypothetical protein
LADTESVAGRRGKLKQNFLKRNSNSANFIGVFNRLAELFSTAKNSSETIQKIKD